MAKTGRGRKHRDWRQTVFVIISILIVLSMALAVVLSVAAPPTG